ncbi:carboxypeptidase-like regulatory domain-containing protein [Halarchaeum nitratireducens]|uniref:Carboxypeptidase regulatory-like domain-containing protein n=1 Tax=Halarchaeum nitratireducens TaxID=489913 RepID=A0A830G7E9_9EURY|nr:carboxypeptidase-like regulatory domain-containing protein [Halarchaeum nitratireducens]GGN06340.1 hypothetical protein GCM10009021_01610 [Halarchaeum nitratireducens]
MKRDSKQVRAVFLAALMVLSVFGGAIAFAGGAAAADTSYGIQAGSVTPNDVNNTSYTTQVSYEFKNLSNDGGTDDLYVTFDQGAQISNINGVNVTATPQGGNQTSLSTSNSGTTSNAGSGTNNQLHIQVSPDSSQLSSSNNTVTVNANLTVDYSSVTSNQTLGVNASVTDSNGPNLNSTQIDSVSVTAVSSNTGGNQTQADGYITGQVEDSNGDPVSNANVSIINNGTTVENITTDSTGTFDPSRVAVTPGDYTVRVEQFGYSTYAQTKTVNSGDTVSFPVTLNFQLSADTLEVKHVDGDTTTGNSSTLLGNGESDNTATYAAILSNSSVEDPNTRLNNSSFTHDVTVDISGLGDLVDNGSVDTTTTVTTENRGDIDGDDYSESYALFDVTADNATPTSLSQPLTQENITASDATANISDSGAYVQYVLEGGESITGEVRNTQGEPVSGATVWAVYDGSSNASQAFAQQTFVNDAGETFLVDQTDDDGAYTIPGLAGDDTDVTLYAVADGYNGINLTTSTVNDYVAAQEAEQTAGAGSVTENHDIVVRPTEVTLDYRVSLGVEDADGNYTNVTRMPTSSERDVQVQLEVKDQNDPASEYELIEDSDLVSQSTVNFTYSGATGVGSVAENPLTVNTTETTAFESTRSTGNVTVTANVENDNETVFNDSVDIEVYGVGEITGQVINDDSPADNLPNANVTLYRVLNNGTEVELRATQTGPQGSYSFTNVETGSKYRVTASYTGASGNTSTGYTDVNKTSGGTSNADVVVVGVQPTQPDNGSGNGDFQQVLETVDAYNNGNASFQDVLNAVEQYNNS